MTVLAVLATGWVLAVLFGCVILMTAAEALKYASV